MSTICSSEYNHKHVLARNTTFTCQTRKRVKTCLHKTRVRVLKHVNVYSNTYYRVQNTHTTRKRAQNTYFSGTYWHVNVVITCCKIRVKTCPYVSKYVFEARTRVDTCLYVCHIIATFTWWNVISLKSTYTCSKHVKRATLEGWHVNVVQTWPQFFTYSCPFHVSREFVNTF